jgi:hypothetical protein
LRIPVIFEEFLEILGILSNFQEFVGISGIFKNVWNF